MSRHGAPGSVLVMVVAMLSALFIVGAAFLTTVTFEGKSIVLERSEKSQSAVIKRLNTEVQAQLKRAFLGFDGKAWNQDSAPPPNQDIGNDRYGEIPGVHPLIASIEPYENDSAAWVYQGVSELESAYLNSTLANVSTLQVDLVLSPAEQWEGAMFRRDADGDGVWDSYEYRLPEDRYPPAIRGDLTERLRADDAYDDAYVVAVPNADPDALYYAVRVVPHGAMVDVGHAHITLLEEILGPVSVDHTNGEAGFVTRAYVPEGEEVLLRRRFLLPPRDTSLSKLQTYPVAEGEIARALYGAFFDPGEWFDTDDKPRWWPMDTGEDGQNIVEITGLWQNLMNPENFLFWEDPNGSGHYDGRHLLTTVSHDDQLMRLGPAASGFDWIEDIVESGYSTDFSIDDWPVFRGLAPADQNNRDTMTLLSGRLKVSLPGLVDTLIKEYNAEGNREIATIDDLVGLRETNRYRQRLLGTIHDAFILMLRNVDNSVMDPPSKALTAASLTANLIDFIDSDGDRNLPGEPTRVEIRNELTGVGTGNFVYGLEAQPYITELYHLNDGRGTYVSAIELFNPYQQPINLSVYKLIDANPANVLLPLDEDLAGRLPAGSYVVFSSDAGAGGPRGADQLGSAGGWQLEGSSQVQLVRKNLGPAGSTEDVIVDWWLPKPGRLFDSVGPPEVSLERVTGVTSGNPVDWEWAWLVPGSWQRQMGQHTMSNGGEDNNARNSARGGTQIRPVQIEFANDGRFLPGNPGGRRLAAVPTTGTLLLLSRYANSASEPFTAKLSADKAKIDNGRMPVFDQSMKADPEPDPAPTPFTLGIPWGQLVFDYFTALPLNHTRNSNWQEILDQDDLRAARDDMIPAIDQNGLRVHGRIDINSAPWRVLAGLPITPMNDIPVSFRQKIGEALYGGGFDASSSTDVENTTPQPIEQELAQSIVAYREARMVTDSSGSGTFDFGGGSGARLRSDGGGNPFTGFLTVGELANVRRPNGGGGTFDFDSGVIDGTGLEDFVKAVAVLVALGDWVTTRSHVFTIYGTLRGAGSKSAVDQRAIRFQETVDRLPCLFNNKSPRRIGPRVVGPYLQANLN